MSLNYLLISRDPRRRMVVGRMRNTMELGSSLSDNGLPLDNYTSFCASPVSPMLQTSPHAIGKPSTISEFLFSFLTFAVNVWLSRSWSPGLILQVEVEFLLLIKFSLYLYFFFKTFYLWKCTLYLDD